MGNTSSRQRKSLRKRLILSAGVKGGWLSTGLPSKDGRGVVKAWVFSALRKLLISTISFARSASSAASFCFSS